MRGVVNGLSLLPMRMGGLGIRSASRLGPAAFWASWADALPMLEKRLPPLAAEITTILEGEQVGGCLGELQLATRMLDRRGFVSRLLCNLEHVLPSTRV